MSEQPINKEKKDRVIPGGSIIRLGYGPILLFLAFFFSSTAVAVDFQACGSCHEATLARDESRPYIHLPFVQRQCGACHTAKASALQAKRQKTSPIRKNGTQRGKVSWMADSVIEDFSHAFILPGNKLGERLVVDRQGRDGKMPREDIAVPFLNELTEVQDNGKPPTISGLKVLEIQRGVFLSVTIGWQTDTLASSQVRYGEEGAKKLNMGSEVSRRFSRQHKVVLYNLKPDERYVFVVVSKDLFGRDVESNIGSFSTSQPIDAARQSQVSESAQTGSDVGLTSSFRRLGQDYLLELTAGRPFSAFVGSTGQIRKQQPKIREIGGSTTASGQHEGLSRQAVVSMDSCRSCHRAQNTTTHPVNVLPKPGMIIPPEYPTLPDGRITCASCHLTHGSDNEYLAIKPGKRELCVGCHKDML